MKLLILAQLLLLAVCGHTQSAGQKTQFGLVAYYFWEEDSSGNIVSDIEQPFEKNHIILFSDSFGSSKLKWSEIKAGVDQLSKEMRRSSLRHIRFKTDSDSYRVKMKLHRTLASRPVSVVYRKTPFGWKSDTLSNILNFESFARPRLVGMDSTIHGKPSGFLGAHWITPDSSYYCSYFPQSVSLRAARHLIYFNGYRRLRKHVSNNRSDGLMATYDRFTYWFQLDDLFNARIKPDETLYFDGSFGVSTSNHRNRLRFGWSYLRAGILKKKKSKPNYKGFNLKSNAKGFEERYEAGKLAGKVYLASHAHADTSALAQDTLDLVPHSMGYAYMLGFLETVEDHVFLNNCYIIAPENAGSRGYDWSKFRHVWQYGTNLDQEDADPIWLQDGVAPQVAVSGLERLPRNQGGRVFTPRDWPVRNFIDSHMVYGYYWIFELLKPGMPGYVE